MKKVEFFRQFFNNHIFFFFFLENNNKILDVQYLLLYSDLAWDSIPVSSIIEQLSYHFHRGILEVV